MNTLKKNIIFSIAYQILVIFLPLITSVHLSAVIGAEGIGQYSYSHSIALYFTYFILLGLNKYGNRMIAAVQEDREKRSRIFCEIFAMQVICFVPSVLVYIAYAFFGSENRMVSLIQTIFVLSALFDVNWFFFGMEMFDKTVVRNLLVKVATTVAIILLVKSRTDVEKYTLIMSVGYLISQLMLWPYIVKLVEFKKIRIVDIRKHIKPNITLFLPVIAVSLYKVMDKIMLGVLSTNVSVGYYENAERIINIPISIITALGNVMLPRTTALVAQSKMKEASKHQDKTMLVVTSFTVLIAFGLMICSETLVVWMYGESFYASASVLRYLAVTIIFLGMGNVVRTQYLIPCGYDRIYIVSAFLGAIVNFLINSLLIRKYGAVGAAIGTIGAEFAVCAYQLLKVRRKIHLKMYMADLAACTALGAGMCWAIGLLPTFRSLFLQLLVSAVLGFVIYVCLFAVYFLLVCRKRNQG